MRLPFRRASVTNSGSGIIWNAEHRLGSKVLARKCLQFKLAEAVLGVPFRQTIPLPKLWNACGEPLKLLCCCAPAYEHSDTVITESENET